MKTVKLPVSYYKGRRRTAFYKPCSARIQIRLHKVDRCKLLSAAASYKTVQHFQSASHRASRGQKLFKKHGRNSAYNSGVMTAAHSVGHKSIIIPLSVFEGTNTVTACVLPCSRRAVSAGLYCKFRYCMTGSGHAAGVNGKLKRRHTAAKHAPYALAHIVFPGSHRRHIYGAHKYMPCPRAVYGSTGKGKALSVKLLSQDFLRFAVSLPAAVSLSRFAQKRRHGTVIGGKQLRAFAAFRHTRRPSCGGVDSINYGIYFVASPCQLLRHKLCADAAPYGKPRRHPVEKCGDLPFANSRALLLIFAAAAKPRSRRRAYAIGLLAGWAFQLVAYT